MSKANRLLHWFIATLVIFGLSACHSIQYGNDANREAPDYHTARISLSWDGIYSGTIPSTNGQMINVLLILNYNETFDLSYSYVDVPDEVFTAHGKLKWDKSGTNINVKVKNFPSYYWVVSNSLILLDSEGKVMTDDQSENYALKKVKFSNK